MLFYGALAVFAGGIALWSPLLVIIGTVACGVTSRPGTVTRVLVYGPPTLFVAAASLYTSTTLDRCLVTTAAVYTMTVSGATMALALFTVLGFVIGSTAEGMFIATLGYIVTFALAHRAMQLWSC